MYSKAFGVLKCSVVAMALSALWLAPVHSHQDPGKIDFRRDVQPILKQFDLGKVRCGLRADDPVGPGKPACILERPNEAPADEVPRRKRGASERYSLAVDRGWSLACESHF